MIGELQIEAEQRLSRLLSTLESKHHRIASDMVPDEYARAYLETNGSHKYNYRSPRLLELEARIAATDPEALLLYNRYLLLRRFVTFSPAGGEYNVPPSIIPLYDRELSRILNQIGEMDCAYFSFSSDLFLKDLAILSHRLIPVGAEFAEPGSGIPRRALIGGGVMQFLRGAMFVLLRTFGLKPFFELHTHVLALDDFHYEGWIETYHRLADLLEANPSVRGWMSASWFLDPALSVISPRLAHLREVPEGGGALLLFITRDEEGRSGALSRSKTRQRLFAEGHYVPAIHMRIWDRRSALAWSRRRRAAEPPVAKPKASASETTLGKVAGPRKIRSLQPMEDAGREEPRP